MTQSNRYVAPLALLMTVGLFACAQQRSEESAAAADTAMSEEAQRAVVPELPAAAPMEVAPVVQAPGVAASQMASDTGTAGDPRRRFVRTAQARFAVADVYKTALAIEDAAAAEGGFITANKIGAEMGSTREKKLGNGQVLQLSEFVTRGNLVVRVPSDRTQAFLRGIVKHMAFLDQRDFAANDVQFELLRRQLAYRRGDQVQGDIASAGEQPGRTGAKVDAAVARGDAMAARDEAIVAQRELEDQVAFSTIRLELYQPAQVRETVVPDTEEIIRSRGPGFFHQVGQALKSGWTGLLQVLVALVTLWPLWLAVAIGAWGLLQLRRWRARRASLRPVAPPAAD